VPIAPGATIGILGGGQLGRMTAMAAREMGFRLRVLDPDPACAARFLVDEQIVAGFDDTQAARRLASACDVLTLEIEKIGTAGLRAAAELVPVRPDAAVLEVIQDRVAQKTWLDRTGFPVGAYKVGTTEGEIAAALVAFGRSFVKAARGGYDGRGQFEAESAADAPAAFKGLGGESCIIERALPVDREISVLVARSPSGQVAVYAPAENHHESRILAWSVLPARISPSLARRAEELARGVAEALAIEGLLCVEIFEIEGELLVNELAPRPHNSYHASVVGAATSQFEQHVRAVCDLPLGSTAVVRPAAIANLLGDIWTPTPPAFERALELPGVRLHLYGKAGARPGRKMGHLSATADTSDAAVALVREAKARLAQA
jgi:5-(carboxyamino)imidazole ribonucleotide synthase